ncbi:MAG TPA: CRISPR-associated endonuclease Cas1 [Cyanobacteria bacterium UBA8803]|nr:CRISPR-associated endonuclease Cas1 [Cyanobacteria bacterium UBA8803]
MNFTIDDLMAAWRQVRLGSRAAGVDGITTDLFVGVAAEQLLCLQHHLQQECYQASPAKGFYLRKANGGKRLIGIPVVRDRIVQRLLLEEIYLPLEEVFLDCSYAYRPGRGIQRAVQHLFSYYQFQPAWVLKADIAQFFDHLCHALLLTDLEQLELEPILLQLIEGQIKSGIVLGGRRLFPQKGVLQGAVLSGALANLYLTEFDRLCLSQGINLVRYGDDFAVVAADWLQVNRAWEKIAGWLSEMYLTLAPEKTKIFAPDEAFVFLGYEFCGGKVTAPPPIEAVKPGTVPASGTPYRRQVGKPVKLESRPPKACSIVKSFKLPIANPEHYWREPMTTLYITDQGAYLKVQHQQFLVYYQQELKCKVPVNRVSHIVLFGCCNLSHGAVSLALRRRIPVLYLSQKGRYFGRLQTEGHAEVEYLVRQVQYSLDEDFTRRQAKSIVLGKLHNSRVLLLRLNRRAKSEKAAKAIDELALVILNVPDAESIEVLLGYEGYGATVYFQALGTLFKEPFEFEKRTRRPPTDPVNSLLSLGYTLLSQNIYSLVQAVGLHTHFGNLHVPRQQHPALVSDLMEEFRALLVDSLVAYLINSKIFVPADFTPPDERGGVYLYPDALKKFLKHWEEKLQSQITHPHTGYKVNYRRCLELQVWEYIACLKGEQEVYRPVRWDKW